MATAAAKKTAHKFPPRKQLLDDNPSDAVSQKKVTVARKGAQPVSVVSGLLSVVRKKLPPDQQDRAALLSDGPVLSDVQEWISTGFPALDAILGGGLAVGRVSEWFGPEGSGKSALSHACVKACQQMGGEVVFFDFEAALDSKTIQQLGVDTSKLMYVVPDDAEQGGEMLEKMIEALKTKKPAAPILFVWDSVAAAPAREEREKAVGEGGYGGARKAAAMSLLARKIMLELPKARAHVLFVNQERDAVGKVGMFIEPVVPGGRGIKYAASQRVRVQRVMTQKKTVNKKAVATSYIIKTSTRKCRLTPPHQSVELILDFKRGLSPELTMLYHLTDEGVVKRSKGMLKSPWSAKTISEDEWVRLYLTDSGFKEKADLAYAPLAKASNWVNAKADTVSEDEGATEEID